MRYRMRVPTAPHRVQAKRIEDAEILARIAEHPSARTHVIQARGAEIVRDAMKLYANHPKVPARDARHSVSDAVFRAEVPAAPPRKVQAAQCSFHHINLIVTIDNSPHRKCRIAA